MHRKIGSILRKCVYRCAILKINSRAKKNELYEEGAQPTSG